MLTWKFESRRLTPLACLLALDACSDEPSDSPSSFADSGAPPSGVVAGVKHDCADGTDVVRSENVIAIAADGTNVFAVLFDFMTIELLAVAPGGGSPRSVVSFDYDALSPARPLLQIDTSEAGGRIVDHLMADAEDGYVYFAGNRYFWRVPKAGGNVELVGADPLPSGWLGRCGFIPDVLTEDSLFACRDDAIFRMPRASGGMVSKAFAAPDGSAIEGFDVRGSRLFVGGTWGDDGAGSLLEVDLQSGASRAVEIPAGLSPQYLLLQDDRLFFNSLSDQAFSTPGLAEIQGLYRLDLESESAELLSTAGLDVVQGAVVDRDYVYNVYSTTEVVRFPSGGGDYQLFVDCTESADFGRIQEMTQDSRSIYLKMEGYGVRRYDK